VVWCGEPGIEREGKRPRRGKRVGKREKREERERGERREKREERREKREHKKILSNLPSLCVFSSSCVCLLFLFICYFDFSFCLVSPYHTPAMVKILLTIVAYFILMVSKVVCLPTQQISSHHDKSRNHVYNEEIGIGYLEKLGFKYGTDKSKDDHKYVDIYASLFNYLRHRVHNVTEIGVAAGQSLQVWHRYFTRATIFGVDIAIKPEVAKNLAKLPRVNLQITDCQKEAKVSELPFAPESMDIIIDDGPHSRVNQEVTLRNFWRFVKPGGLYIMEDVDGNTGGLDYQESPDLLTSFTRDVFQNNHVTFMDRCVIVSNVLQCLG
jgi:SAM-dependent methyltransferase